MGIDHRMRRLLGRVVKLARPTVDAMDLVDNLEILVHDAATGELMSRQTTHNLVTLAGRNLIRDLVLGNTTSYVKNFAVGTSGTAVTSADTALNAEVYRDVLTSITPSSGVATFSYFLGSTAANGSTLQEAGLLTASSGGTLFAHSTFQPIVKTASVTVTYNWNININAS